MSPCHILFKDPQVDPFTLSLNGGLPVDLARKREAEPRDHATDLADVRGLWLSRDLSRTKRMIDSESFVERE